MFDDLDSQEAFRGMGKTGLTILRGVLADGGTIQEGLVVLTAFFTSMFMQNQNVPKESEET